MPPQKRKPMPSQASSKTSTKHRKAKGPAQRPPQQRVKILGANGKVRFEWRDW